MQNKGMVTRGYFFAMIKSFAKGSTLAKMLITTFDDVFCGDTNSFAVQIETAVGKKTSGWSSQSTRT